VCLRPLCESAGASFLLVFLTGMQVQLPGPTNSYGVIYCTTNLVSGRKYIGQDSKNNPKYLGSGVVLKDAISKHGGENFQKEVLQYCIDGNDLNESEIYWIDYFGAVKSDLFYNLADGGVGGMSELKKNNFVPHANSLIALEKLAKSRIGTKSSKKTRLLISKAHKGLPMHVNTRDAIMAAVKRPIVKLTKDFDFVAQFSCIKDAAESLGVEFKVHSVRTGITDVARGKQANGKTRKSAFGFKWMYLEDYKNLYGK